MPKYLASAALIVAFPLLAYPSSPKAAEPSVVMITLQDASADPSIAGMTMKIDNATVKAGRVTLQAVNASKELVHEVLVVPAPATGSQLPYDPKSNRVIEKRIHSLGEISDLKPGGRGKLTLRLKPGAYLLFCNQAGHYKAGMSTTLNVEK